MIYQILTIVDTVALIQTTEEGITSSVGIDLKNKDYQAFLAWNAEQEEPLTLPENWPTF